MYYIRADANEKIGTGHVMRCLSIAEELRKRGEQITFIVADDHSRNMIEEYRYPTICLNSVWNNLEFEMDTFVKIIKLYKIEQLLIDSYFVTKRYLSTLKQYVRVAYLDDLNAFIYPVDILINYNIYATSLNYKKDYQNAGVETELILGCQYVPLRKEFVGIKRTINKNVSKVLITSGGTDNYGITEKILYALQSKSWFHNLEYYIILGKFNIHAQEMKAHWKDCSNIHLLDHVKNISYYMTECDIAITAGGSTVYELCACGIPSVMYTQADNQYDIARSMSDLNLIPWVGDIRTDVDKCVNSIIQCIEFYCSDVNIRKHVSRKMKKAVDGKGCIRLVDRLLKTGVLLDN